MAAAITTTATTLEGQMLEIAREIEELELAIPAANRSELNQRLTVAPDPEAGVINITITLPATLGGTGGAITYTAVAYLS